MKGFETFFAVIKPTLKTKQDVVVAFIHFMLVHEHDFVCVGLGEVVRLKIFSLYQNCQ